MPFPEPISQARLVHHPDLYRLLDAHYADPSDATTRGVLADFIEEHGIPHYGDLLADLRGSSGQVYAIPHAGLKGQPIVAFRPEPNLPHHTILRRELQRHGLAAALSDYPGGEAAGDLAQSPESDELDYRPTEAMIWHLAGQLGHHDIQPEIRDEWYDHKSNYGQRLFHDGSVITRDGGQLDFSHTASDYDRSLNPNRGVYDPADDPRYG